MIAVIAIFAFYGCTKEDCVVPKTTDVTVSDGNQLKDLMASPTDVNQAVARTTKVNNSLEKLSKLLKGGSCSGGMGSSCGGGNCSSGGGLGGGCWSNGSCNNNGGGLCGGNGTGVCGGNHRCGNGCATNGTCGGSSSGGCGSSGGGSSSGGGCGGM